MKERENEGSKERKKGGGKEEIHFLAHLVYQPKSLIQSYNHALSVGIHKHTCPQYMHIKYLVILTCSF